MPIQNSKCIKEIIDELHRACGPACKCSGRSLEKLCKARDIGMKTFAECLEESPWECSHAIYFGTMWFCCCLPRVQIANGVEIAA
jgi:hypothetical protein